MTSSSATRLSIYEKKNVTLNVKNSQIQTIHVFACIYIAILELALLLLELCAFIDVFVDDGVDAAFGFDVVLVVVFVDWFVTGFGCVVFDAVCGFCKYCTKSSVNSCL